MVSFWPWRSSSPSPDSFEKTLSALSVKIRAAQSSLDGTRSRARRVKVLGTLYLSFGYLVYAIVLLLVVGWRRLGATEWAGVVAGPVGIWALGAVASTYYSFRGETLQSRLTGLQAERADTIRKLKDATRYDSTLQLLEKYGGADKGAKKRRDGGGDGEADREAWDRRRQQTDPAWETPTRTPSRIPGRTGLPPPPTANIVRTPERHMSPSIRHLLEETPTTPLAGEDFTPSPFGVAWPMTYHQPATAPPSEPHWYDRILDTLLGEDEVAAKNRIVLICGTCRLVNGQAPPGTKRLSELGPWKCMACGAMNGEMEESEKRDVVLGRSVSSDETVDVDGEDTPRRGASRGEDEDKVVRRRKGKTKN